MTWLITAATAILTLNAAVAFAYASKARFLKPRNRVVAAILDPMMTAAMGVALVAGGVLVVATIVGILGGI